MTNELEPKPRYRVTGEHHVAIMGMLFPPGAEVVIEGWPPAGLEPLNEAARRIHAFGTANRFDPFTVSAPPFSIDHGRFLLLQAEGLGETIRIVPQEAEAPDMPRYVALRDLPGETDIDDRRFGFRNLAETYAPKIRKGEEIAMLAWPRRMRIGKDFAPANAEADRVVAYFDEFAEHPDLMPAPWDHFAREVFLPELRALPRRQVA